MYVGSFAEEKLAGVPLLVFANKQDLLSAKEADEVSKMFGLTEIKDRTWQVVACSAKTGDGLQDGMEWLMKTMAEKKK